MIAIGKSFRLSTADKRKNQDHQNHRRCDILPAGAPQNAGPNGQHELNVPTYPIDAVHPAEAEQLGHGQGERHVCHSVVVHVINQTGTCL